MSAKMRVIIHDVSIDDEFDLDKEPFLSRAQAVACMISMQCW